MNIHDKLKKLREDLHNCQLNPWFNVQEEKDIEDKLDLAIWMEEKLWRDKFRDLRSKSDSANSKCFHVSTIVKRKHTKTKKIRNTESIWLENRIL